ncbi:hypothetical protein K8I85_09055 [bacterium]|nr:hypothetical protein [bacterium]
MNTSTAKKRPRSTYWEILVQGQPDKCEGLLAGLLLGAKSDARLFLANQAGIRTPLGERLMDLVHAHAGVCHVIADAEGRRLLRSVAKKLPPLGMTIADEKKVASASFDYEFHAYAKRYGDEIRKLLASLPKGLSHTGDKPKETRDASAKGVEAYSPAHDYEIEGKGSFSGRVDQVLEARAMLNDHPLVNVGNVELESG